MNVTVQVWGRPPVCRLPGPLARHCGNRGPRSQRLREPADRRSAPRSGL